LVLKKIRKHLVWIVQIFLFVAVFFAVSAWQARNLLTTDRQSAPQLTGQTLDGQTFDLAEIGPRPVLVYFFAPWCHICAASSDNVRRLRELRDVGKLSIIVVALDYESVDAIREYATRHELNVPVIIGDEKISTDWHVFGFPTYYVLDDQHRVVSRDFGYTTQLGLWWRSWLP
jgi:thiol-disulfide isomerase/thioredoxin